jgi:hypothetical protein
MCTTAPDDVALLVAGAGTVEVAAEVCVGMVMTGCGVALVDGALLEDGLLEAARLEAAPLEAVLLDGAVLEVALEVAVA